jgi:hypothetical protein
MAIAKLEFEDLVSGAERLERLDAAHHVFLCDSTIAPVEATQTAEDAHELGKLDESTVSLAGAHAYIYDLHAELALPIAKPEGLFPPAAATWPGEGVDADGSAHLLKGAAEAGIAAYVRTVVGGETGECSSEVVELGMEGFDLFGGELVGEGVVGLERFLLSVKGSQTCATSTMHGNQN